MEKTRLGISVGLLAAIMYFMGILNLLGLLLIAGYIFCFVRKTFGCGNLR